MAVAAPRPELHGTRVRFLDCVGDSPGEGEVERGVLPEAGQLAVR
jgi:hypothetical protein